MSAHVEELKRSLRLKLRASLQDMTSSERTEASARLCHRLRRQRVFGEAGSVLFYAPLPEEPDIWPLLLEALSQDQIVTLPRHNVERRLYEVCQIRDTGRDLASGPFGIREPAAHCPVVPLNRLDFILVPGLGFALDGARLGRGKGCYDRLLAQVPGCKCGVGFDCQVGLEIPVEPHDVLLDCIISPSRWQEFAGRRTDVK
ncbi:MAG TPA: 5-formyltetrahydrofolate cyclo-ligase [Verrucomicrobiae bacterium]|jgi:5-formyltetrahydrofolate cyclo-ligase